jgi:lysophospholipase L1-like esterase
MQWRCQRLQPANRHTARVKPENISHLPDNFSPFVFFCQLAPPSIHSLLGGLRLKNSSLFVCLFLTVFFSQGVHATPHIEVYGDSISAGFLSHTDVTNAPSLVRLSETISNLAMFLMDKEKNRSYVDKEHAPELAWPKLLSDKIDPAGPVTLYNYAVSSSRTWEMAGQVKGNKHTSGETRAFFFIGHNDLCNNMDTPNNIASDFGYEFSNAIAAWDATHKDSVAYLIPIADIHRVYEALDGYVWHKGGKRDYSCVDSWTKFFPYCPSHYKRHQAGTLGSYMKPRLSAMNAALDDLANQWNKKSASNQFAYLKDAHDAPYQKEFFAVDCFHLSPRGQSMMADRVLQLVNDFEGP